MGFTDVLCQGTRCLPADFSRRCAASMDIRDNIESTNLRLQEVLHVPCRLEKNAHFGETPFDWPSQGLFAVLQPAVVFDVTPQGLPCFPAIADAVIPGQENRI